MCVRARACVCVFVCVCVCLHVCIVHKAEGEVRKGKLGLKQNIKIIEGEMGKGEKGKGDSGCPLAVKHERYIMGAQT